MRNNVNTSVDAAKQEQIKILQRSCLFEVSWEVCNKVGGIYTVLCSKLKEALKYFGRDNYILIGPLLESNRDFVDDNSSGLASSIASILRDNGFACRVGYWDVDGKPITILVDFKNRYKLDVLLYNLWSDFKVDSLASNYDYQEPILFATAAGEVIEILGKNKIIDGGRAIIAQFHEWLCGAGLLYLKKNYSEVSTVFTTHATVLGRALAGTGTSIYNLPQTFDPVVEARKKGVFAKHSLEQAAAREAHCFTTVSSITADEAYLMLGKYPDKIVFNGLNIDEKLQVTDRDLGDIRSKLREIAGKIIGKELPKDTLLWMTSGRYEFHNKGFDMLLNSLAQLETRLAKDAPPIVVFFLLAVNWHTRQDSLLEADWAINEEQKNALGIATHRLYDPDHDSIIRTCNELNLKGGERKVHVIFSDAYLNGNDGVFDIVYEKILAACDFSFFPSFYEPWGYTPLESIMQQTPTATTDLAGFGNWVRELGADCQDAVYVLERKNKNDTDFVSELTECLEHIIEHNYDNKYSVINALRKKAFKIAELADWRLFYVDYLNAYYQALKFNEIYRNKFDVSTADRKTVTTILEKESLLPRFRTMQYDSPLPVAINVLRELAYNFWWSWNDDAKMLFQKINPELWEVVKHNPIYFLNQVSHSALQKVSRDYDYMKEYERTISAFRGYHKGKKKDAIKFCNSDAVNEQHPIAYFCMEYGIDECLPIYSGGLGILAGDYLKAMSDLKVPFIAIGLFYKQGYFLQNINSRGNQVAVYETWNTNRIPMNLMSDDAGNVLLVGVDVLGHTVYSKVWEVKVGQVKLYLLDTDVPENSLDDREITNSLYGGSREVRLKQEIILGVGGTRFILEKLQITPAIYHLNEGHSAFLLLERIRNYHHQGLTLEEAKELVRCTSIFTTHTPVPAGNEEFSEDLITKYFSPFVQRLGITIDELFAWAHSGLSVGEPETKITANGQGLNSQRIFSMTALSLRLCLYSNAVSTLHGKVARQMWRPVWTGLLENEVPITHVTNGVHLGTWLGSGMRSLYDNCLGSEWRNNQDDPKFWRKILSVSDREIWKAHQQQKNHLIEIVKKLILQQYSLRNESKQLIAASIKSLDKDVLLLGLARRFTSYKRNDLILKDKDRLARILTDEKRPIVMLIAGKSHPADGGGNNLIRDVIETIREPQFKGHIIFLEEYNIGLAKALVGGVDVWINTPILGHEACGTSGMKVAVNGGLNFSTQDGWWEEAYNAKIGWDIESMLSITDVDKRNDIENMFLLNTLESNIAPLYYSRRKIGFNTDWISKIKASIALIACEYNVARMAKNYISTLYAPATARASRIIANDYRELKEIVVWKQGLADRFNTVKIKAILVDGVKDGKIISQGMIKIRVLLFPGKLPAHELCAELILVKTDGRQFVDKPILVSLQLTDSLEAGVLTYTAEYKIEDTGFYSYGVRIFPYSDKLLWRHDAGIVYWG